MCERVICPTSLSVLPMTNPIARRPELVKCDQIYIRATSFLIKNTICIIRELVTFWIPNFGLVTFNIIYQALV
jgi:hypothetical protein